MVAHLLNKFCWVCWWLWTRSSIVDSAPAQGKRQARVVDCMNNSGGSTVTDALSSSPLL